ncbi:MAG: hypothetical protein INH43_05795 [Acidobacteriaceae bacterium]|jgi:hypothetical protein|nr:hypothetical protein [Acidobacteriaceae bacterium]
MDPKTKRKRGRPPAASDTSGQPVKTSEWPRLSIRIEPKTKATLSALAAETGQSLWEVLGAVVASHLETMKPKTRKAIAARVAEAARASGDGD